MNIQFAMGTIAAIGSMMMIRDWYGMEAYIQHLQDTWIDLPWWVSIGVVVVASWFGKDKGELK